MTDQAERHAPLVIDEPHAPFIYFEGASNFGYHNGNLTVTVAVARSLSDGLGGVTTDYVAVAHLKCTLSAARELQRAIDDAMLLGVPASGTG
jgi:hypothetical protein